jgi:hypothetical protein
MKVRPFVLALLVWASFDFANPDLPGAVVFNADDCIDAVEKRPTVPQDQPAGPLAAPPWEKVEPPAARRIVLPPTTLGVDRPPPWSGWTVRRQRLIASAPPSGEDH